MTHTRRSDSFDGYNRGRQWEITCTEVAKLRLAQRGETETVEAVGGEMAPLVTSLVRASASADDDSGSGLRRRVSNPRPGG